LPIRRWVLRSVVTVVAVVLAARGLAGRAARVSSRSACATALVRSSG